MISDIVASSDRRIFFLGVNTGYVTGGRPDHRYVDFYARRSSPKLHCAIVGNVVVPGGHGTNVVTPMLTSETVWSDLAAAIRSRGSLPGIQLSTTWEGYRGMHSFLTTRPTEVFAEARKLASAVGVGGAVATLDKFEKAAAIAAAHNFGHIQVHAGHGYLLSLLIDDRFNGDAGRVRDRLSALSQHLRTLGIETSIRISMRTGEPTFDDVGGLAFHNVVSDLQFDYVDLSSGFYNIDKRLIYPARPDILADRLADSLAVSIQHPDRQFILSGHALRHDSTRLPKNLHFGVCRDLIANPDILEERRNGCANMNKCHYFSRGESHLTCGRWSESKK